MQVSDYKIHLKCLGIQFDIVVDNSFANVIKCGKLRVFH